MSRFPVGVFLGAGVICSCQVSHPSNFSTLTFSTLTPRVQSRVQPYSLAAADTILQELTAADVRAVSKQHAYTWVVTRAPWCEPWKQYAEQFKRYQQQLAERDINLVFVDIAYSATTAMGSSRPARQSAGLRHQLASLWPRCGC